MSSKRITSTHSDYDDIHAAWVTNNRPSQFDRQGSWGWAAYRVIDVSATSPDFYQFASTSPTVIDDKGNVTNKGMTEVNDIGFYERIRFDRNGLPTFRMIEPPNELN